MNQPITTTEIINLLPLLPGLLLVIILPLAMAWLMNRKDK